MNFNQKIPSIISCNQRQDIIGMRKRVLSPQTRSVEHHNSHAFDYMTYLYNTNDPIKFRPAGVQAPGNFAVRNSLLTSFFNDYFLNHMSNKGAVIVLNNNDTFVCDTIKKFRQSNNQRDTLLFVIGRSNNPDMLRTCLKEDRNSLFVQDDSNNPCRIFNMALQCLQRFELGIIIFDRIKDINFIDRIPIASFQTNVLVFNHKDFAKRGFSKLQGTYSQIASSWLSSNNYTNQPEEDKLPKITYIVPTRIVGYRPNNILKTIIGSIRNQLYTDIEIIISEHDQTSKIKPLDYEPFKHIFIEDKQKSFFNKCEAMNTAAVKCDSNNLVFHDGDILIDNCYTLQLSNILNSYDSCHILDYLFYSDEQSTNLLCNGWREPNQINLQKVRRYVEGGSIACRKKSFLDVGGFYERFAGYGCEDSEFMDRIYTTNFYNKRNYNCFHLYHTHASDVGTQNTITHQMWKEFKEKYSLEQRIQIFKQDFFTKYNV